MWVEGCYLNKTERKLWLCYQRPDEERNERVRHTGLPGKNIPSR